MNVDKRMERSYLQKGDITMQKRVTTRTLQKQKQEQEPIAMITAYDFPSAKLAERAGAEILLVGDSLGTTVLGYDSTIPVTLDDILHHAKAVTRGAQHAMVIADLPFMTAHLDKQDVLKAAGRLMQEAGVYGVKIEGGSEVLSNIEALVQAGIPVMGHLGLTPQSVNQLGGYLIQGKNTQQAQQLIQEAQLLEETGVFALVLECVPEEVASMIRERCRIPVIGIGAGRSCDGQVLVFHDLLSFGGGFSPSFVKQYADIGNIISEAIHAYVQEVKNKKFPEEKHVSHLSRETLKQVYGE